MLRSNVLFVVGAGASKEVNLPIGSELAAQIVEELNFDSGSNIELLRSFGREETGLYAASQRLKEVLPLAKSIDHCIDNQADEKMSSAGKLAVAKIIADAERESLLNPEGNGSIDFGGLQNTWYIDLFKMLTARVPAKELTSVFEKVSFVVFNYDRCIEHFLTEALMYYYALGLEESREIVSKIKIFHIYGSLGTLYGDNSFPFGTQATRANLPRMAANVRTFSERQQSSSTVEQIESVVRRADNVIFLGFGFQDLNMQWLTLNSDPNGYKTVYLTTLGLSPYDQQTVENDIRARLRMVNSPIRFAPNSSCKGLFEVFTLTFDKL